MKMLVHKTPLTANRPVQLERLGNHARVDHYAEAQTLENMAFTAAADIEHFSGLALLMTTVRVTIFKPVWGAYGLALPIGPVADDHVPTVLLDGEAFTGFDFEAGKRPYIRWLAPYYELTPERMVIEYQAGFGMTADDVPEDLAQAIMDQVALLYDGRSPMDAKSLTSSPHMARVGARYRGVSL